MGNLKHQDGKDLPQKPDRRVTLALSDRNVMRWLIWLALIVFGTLNAQSQMIVAHRGASYAAPENTISAFQLAWEEQADGVEGDFYYTKDGHIVCIHDKDTLRTSGVKKVVAESTLQELRELDYGSWKGEQFKGEPIPTFAEVLNVIPDSKWFIIELKTGPEIVPLLKAEIERLRPDRSRLWVIAFNAATVAAVKATLPDVRAHWLTGFRQDKLTGDWQPTAQKVAETIAQCKADGIGVQGQRAVVTEPFIDHLKSQGLREFHVWTIDDPRDAMFFKKLGACGITTNKPEFIRTELVPSED